MKQSLTYYLTLLVIKFKGIKKNFNIAPIDYKKIRKEDVRYPSYKFSKQNLLKTFKVSETLITEIGLNKSSDKLLIFIHGGAFISGPAQHHWDTAKEIAIKTNYIIWMCDYPKAPENKITTITKNIDSVYYNALKKYSPNKISFIGDSAGGTLITCLIQRLVIKNHKLPNKIILISPVMDASMSNPEIEKINAKDPMLSVKGVVSAKKMCVDNEDLKNKIISPFYGDFKNFPKTVLCIAENDITYPDQKLTIQKMKAANIDLLVIEGKNMPHIWPLLPVMKEAKTSLKNIIDIINNKDNDYLN